MDSLISPHSSTDVLPHETHEEMQQLFAFIHPPTHHQPRVSALFRRRRNGRLGMV